MLGSIMHSRSIITNKHDSSGTYQGMGQLARRYTPSQKGLLE